jgi:hypothetical protein
MKKFLLLKEQLSIEEKVRRVEHFARKTSLKSCMLYSCDEQTEYGIRPPIYPINFIIEKNMYISE